MMNSSHFLIVTMLASALMACGGDSEPNAGQAPAGASSADIEAAAARADIAEATRSMVSAVSGGKQGELLDLKFELKSRPQVGEPLTIDIALIPRVSSEQLSATFIANEGLTVRASETPADYRNVQRESMYRQELIVVPKENGVYFLNAVVMIRTEAGDLTRTFSIPVLVGPPPEESDSQAAK